jgi:homoserine dehydrogenase
MKNSINIAILGLGNIGTEFVNALNLQTNSIENSFGYKINIKKILISNKSKKRTANIDNNILTTNPNEIFEDKSINVVVELMGGTNPSYSYVTNAIKSNKSIITANKDLIASHGKEIFELAKANNVSVFFEAAVASGTPIISTLIRDLSAVKIQSIRAIINGTSNFILTKMDENRMEFNAALDLAKDLGYAEPDPTNDIEGFDARYKLAILSSLSFNTQIKVNDIYVEGIKNIDTTDFNYAKELGYTIKLLAIVENYNNGILARVHPTMINITAPLAKISGALNAIEIKADMLGEIIIQGPGAGASPTTAAILNDLISLIKNEANSIHSIPNINKKIPLINIKKLESRFYLRFVVKDQPGVLSKMSNILGEKKISIASVIQKENPNLNSGAELVFMTYKSTQSAIDEAIKKIVKLDIVEELKSVFRVE